MKPSAEDLHLWGEHLNPQHDRIVVWREPEPKQTKQGLHLPDTIEQSIEVGNLRPGIVVKVGKGRWDPHGAKRCPMDLEPGQRVMFHKNAGEKVFAWGQCFQIMGDGDVGLVVQSDTPLELVYATIAGRG